MAPTRSPSQRGGERGKCLRWRLLPFWPGVLCHMLIMQHAAAYILTCSFTTLCKSHSERGLHTSQKSPMTASVVSMLCKQAASPGQPQGSDFADKLSLKTYAIWKPIGVLSAASDGLRPGRPTLTDLMHAAGTLHTRAHNHTRALLLCPPSPQ